MSNNISNKNKSSLRLTESSLRKIVRTILCELEAWQPPAALQRKGGGSGPDYMDHEEMFRGLGGYSKEISGERFASYGKDHGDEDSSDDGDDGDGDGENDV